MRFQHSYTMDLSPDEAVALHRDHVPDFAPRLPGVGHVERVEYRSLPGERTRVVHRWFGDLSVIPWVLRKMIDERAFQWSDSTVWDAKARTCRWELVVPILGDAVRIDGGYTMRPAAGGTEVRVDAVLAFVPSNSSPFVQTALGRRMLPLLERFIVHLYQQVMSASSPVIRAWADENLVAAA